MQESRIEGAVLDVWEQEPRIDYSLLDLVDIGTPHIAGSAQDGKIRATEMVYKELCRYFEIPSSWDADSLYPESRVIYPQKGTTGQETVLSVLLQAYNIMCDDADLRELRSIPSNSATVRFDQLRNEYRLRPEFRHFVVGLAEQSVQSVDIFEALGFKVRSDN